MRTSFFALMLLALALPAVADPSSARYRVSGIVLGAGSSDASGAVSGRNLGTALGMGPAGSAGGASGIRVAIGGFGAPEPIGLPDMDGDGWLNAADNCPTVANADQLDRGGVGAGSSPDGIGDACQCGDVSGDGRVTTADAVLISRSLLNPPTATLARPQLCDVGGGTGATCTLADVLIIRRALLMPATAQIAQACRPDGA